MMSLVKRKKQQSFPQEPKCGQVNLGTTCQHYIQLLVVDMDKEGASQLLRGLPLHCHSSLHA